MDTATKIWIFTTNPHTRYDQLLIPPVIISILLHSIFYILLLKLLAYIFRVKLNYNFIFLILLFVMIFGYPMRLWRAKTIYRYYQTVDPNKAQENTTNYMNSAYARWYFLS